jgi:pimeloyl-ACP methyl ester carboxylesterase
MATFMIVHGGWGGGWEWTPVARRLREHSHEVFTPTLTGLGERAHLGSDVGLSDHVADVIAVFRFEELHDVVLCGHSYGGMVVTGVADRASRSIRLLAYLDAFVPSDGQALQDLASSELQKLIHAAEEQGDGTFPYPEEIWPPPGAIPERKRARYIERMLPHPLGTITEPVRLSGAAEPVPRAFVRCTGGEHAEPEEEMAPYAAKAREEEWLYRESATPHDLHLFDPDGTAAILHDLATSSAGITAANGRGASPASRVWQT